MPNAADVYQRAQTLQTRNLIEHFGQNISLIRERPLVDDGAGGKKRAGSPITFAPVYRYFGGVSVASRIVLNQPDKWFQTEIGERYRSTHVLIGLPDDDIQEHDTFFVDGQKYEVLYVHANKSYQVKAEILLVV